MTGKPKWTVQIMILQGALKLVREWSDYSQCYEYRIESFTGWRLEVDRLLAEPLWTYTCQQIGMTHTDWSVSRETSGE